MKVDFRVYLITDRRVVRGKLIEAVEQALKGGIRAVQLREKDLPVRQLLEMAEKMRELTTRYRARLFINDRVDVAMAVGADGVHLGGNSMPAHAVRKVVGDRMLIGVSTHSLEEALDAERQGADFVTFSPVFDTPSKRIYGPPQGLEKLRTVVERVGIPVFALGGIKADNIPDVFNTGVYGISMISAILGAEDIEEKSREIVRLTK
ncbi:MAG: thiamine phosphate synthase [Nitrospirae bacterium]|nr:MAG: thiamine phosphate synthase [Nitrospirota bacterium]